jgi:hypothetical protein
MLAIDPVPRVAGSGAVRIGERRFRAAVKLLSVEQNYQEVAVNITLERRGASRKHSATW